MTEYMAIGAALTVLVGLIVKKTKTKVDDKYFKAFLDILNSFKTKKK